MPKRFDWAARAATLGLAALLVVAVGFWTSCSVDQKREGQPQSQILEATRFPGTLIGLQYETFFTPHNNDWTTSYAVPILGKYSSLDVSVLRKHAEWFEFMGVDWLLLDWSNMLWLKPDWEEHKGASQELEQSTELLFKTYSQLEREGKRPPKLVIMLGLQNGPLVPHAVERLNGIISWTTKNLFEKPEYKNIWLYYNGKPLVTILFTPPLTCDEIAKQTSGIAAPGWKIRWMGSQLQDTGAAKCGFWSWMDGTIRQVVTYRDGAAEETLVAPGCFPWAFTPDQAENRKGWLDPKAVGRDNGAPYIESWKNAFETRPKFIQIHQWNEFLAQFEGLGSGKNHDLYGDSYNVELSDDIEPIRMDECGYRGCGGWGYYYVNMTKALISLYRNETPDITITALSAERKKTALYEKTLLVTGRELPLTWNTIGKQPASYTLDLDGKTIAADLKGGSYTLSLSGIPGGIHTLVLKANGCRTFFDLDPRKLTSKSDQPLPVTSALEFRYIPE